MGSNFKVTFLAKSYKEKFAKSFTNLRSREFQLWTFYKNCWTNN